MAKESNFKNMVLALFLICFVCSGILGVVYAITKAPIDAAAIAKENAAIAQVLPEFDNDPYNEEMAVSTEAGLCPVYPAKKGDEIVGYAIKASTSKGFGGSILLMVGFTVDGSIYNTSVLSHSETPGLGEKMLPSKSGFSQQFKGKNPASFKLSVKKDGGDVDAITASTITSRAYCDALEKAYAVFQSLTNNTEIE